MTKKFQSAFIIIFCLACSNQGFCIPKGTTTYHVLDSLYKAGHAVCYEQPLKAHLIADTIKKLSRKQNHILNLAKGYYLDGKIYDQVESRYDKALNSYYNAARHFRAVGDKEGIANTLSGIAFSHLLSYNYQFALEYFLEELPYRIELNKKENISCTHNNIGIALHHLSLYDSAIVHLQKAIDINRAMNYENLLSDCYLTIGMCYLNKRDYSNANAYFDLVLLKSEEDSYYKASALNNKGLISMKRGAFKKAEKYYLEALVSQKYVDDKPAVIHAYQNLGELYSKMNKPKNALEYYRLAIDLDPNATNPIVLSEIYKEMIANYESREMYKEANMYNTQLNAFMLPLAAKYEERKELHEAYLTENIKLQFEQNELLAENRNNHTYINWLKLTIGASGIGLCVFFFIAIRLYQTKVSQKEFIADLRLNAILLNRLQASGVDVKGTAMELEAQNPKLKFKMYWPVLKL
ncbi:MAG: tetratricopeptide repeat protein [Ekhidna sp.]